MKKCPNCEQIYMDYDHYCLKCHYRLKYIEGSEVYEYCPEPTGIAFTKKEDNTKPVVTCPYCQSTDTKRISFFSKYLSASIWGVLAMGKVSKQWHCNNCKSDF